MPPTLETTYTTSDDIIGLLGASGLTLRIDDAVASSGGVSGATNASPIEITTAAAHGLSTGTVVLIFGVEGNTAANTEAPITVTGATTFTLDGSSGNAAYSGGGAWFSTGTSQGLTTQAINLATAKVNRFCQSLYDVADLALSWSVWSWATSIACHWLCARRQNPIPSSINNLYLESLDELQAVRSGNLIIEDIGFRNNIMPQWSACRIDNRWSLKKMRVEAGLSDRTPAQYPRQYDLASQIIAPAEIDSIGGAS